MSRPLLDSSHLDVTAHRGAGHYIIAGACGDVAVTLTGVVSPQAAGELRPT